MAVIKCHSKKGGGYLLLSTVELPGIFREKNSKKDWYNKIVIPERAYFILVRQLEGL
jgi:hypothetical protein